MVAGYLYSGNVNNLPTQFVPYPTLPRYIGIARRLRFDSSLNGWGEWCQELGIVGLRLVCELRGISCLPLALCPSPKQSLMVSRSFGRPITTLIEMREAVATYMTRAAEKLRRHHVAAGVLTVFLMTNRFTEEPQYSNSVTIPLPVATQDTAELIRYALQGVEQIFREGYHYQKAGVILTALVPAHQIQARL
jgi:DNA polymerase V